MKVTVHEITEITRRLDVTVPAETVQEELDRIYGEIGQKAKLKGFRPGKIPPEVVKQNFGEEAASDTVKNLVNQSYPEALNESGLHPVSYPEITIRHFKEGEDLAYEAVVEIRPMIDPKGYQGLTLTKNKMEATQEEIDHGLKTLQERSAQLIPILESRPTRAGDTVIFDFHASHAGQPLPGGKVEGYTAELGKSELLADLEGGILGMSPGESRKIDVNFPADFADKNLAGKKVRYDVTLKEMKKRQLSELNDDFAKDLGNFANLVEVQEKLKEQILSEKERRERGGLAAQVVDQLAEKNPFAVPEGLVQMELEGMFRHLVDNLKMQGVPPDQTGLDWENFKKEYRDEARKRVLGSLLFEAIAKKEKIETTEAEIKERLDLMAKQSGQPVSKVEKYYREKNLLPALSSALCEEKTLDFVLSKAKIRIKGD